MTMTASHPRTIHQRRSPTSPKTKSKPGRRDHGGRIMPYQRLQATMMVMRKLMVILVAPPSFKKSKTISGLTVMATDLRKWITGGTSTVIKVTQAKITSLMTRQGNQPRSSPHGTTRTVSQHLTRWALPPRLINLIIWLSGGPMATDKDLKSGTTLRKLPDSLIPKKRSIRK